MTSNYVPQPLLTGAGDADIPCFGADGEIGISCAMGDLRTP